MTRFATVVVVVGCSTSAPPPPGDAPMDGSIEVPFTNGTSTLSGAAAAGYVDGPRSSARFANPVNVAYRDGTLYVADFDNGKIRAIDTATHVTSTIVSAPAFRRPFALAFAADGTLYATTDNDQNGGHSLMSGSVWRIDVAAKTATVVASAMGRPRGLGVLANGTLIVSDYTHHVIETIDPVSGAVALLAGAWDVAGYVDGEGSTARFASPYGLVVRSDNSIVVADYQNHRLRAVASTGVVTTLAGTGAAGFADGDSSTAMFRHPQALALADGGALYISDSDNYRVRKLVGDTVTTIAGTGVPGYLDHDDPMASQLYGLEGIAVVPSGAMVYVADGSRGDDVPYNRVRQIAR
jgi:putative pyrroloquinoline-quinone-binding quinoprotein